MNAPAGPVPQKACVTQDGAPPSIARQYFVGPSSVQVALQSVLASHVIELAHVSGTQDPPEHISPVAQSLLVAHPTQLEPLQMGDVPLHWLVVLHLPPLHAGWVHPSGALHSPLFVHCTQLEPLQKGVVPLHWLVVLHLPPLHAGGVHPSGEPHSSLLVQAAQPAAVQ
jgi:hypothetical protein